MNDQETTQRDFIRLFQGVQKYHPALPPKQEDFVEAVTTRLEF